MVQRAQMVMFLELTKVENLIAYQQDTQHILLLPNKEMLVNILLKAIIFAILVPGVSISIPLGTSLHEKALVHGLVFAVVNFLVYKYVRPMLETFDNPDTKVDQPCPPNSVKCPSGDCKLKNDLYGLCD
jgi:hypothetical protein